MKINAMKIITLICNFILLGIIVLGNISSGIKTENIILVLGVSALLIMNIILISGSKLYISFNPEKVRSTKSPFAWSPFLIIKIIAALVNLIILVFAYISIKDDFSRGSGFLAIAVITFISGTFLLSALTILAGKWNRFEGFRRTFLITGISLFVIVGGAFLTFRIMIGHGIKENIAIAKKEHPGKAEDALLSYLADSTKTPHKRTDVAVWTLGQIRSRKALPVLKSLYKDNPYYHCNHNTELCQYEIHKAIVSIESGWLGAKEKNVFGSWARLNK
jgi:hypothetical protein